jgi:hypothetical protein
MILNEYHPKRYVIPNKYLNFNEQIVFFIKVSFEFYNKMIFQVFSTWFSKHFFFVEKAIETFDRVFAENVLLKFTLLVEWVVGMS